MGRCREIKDQPLVVKLRVYARGEIAAKKLRRILQLLQCRDLLDRWPTFERNARHRGLDPVEFPERFARRIDEYRRRWDSELEG